MIPRMTVLSAIDASSCAVACASMSFSPSHILCDTELTTIFQLLNNYSHQCYSYMYSSFYPWPQTLQKSPKILSLQAEYSVPSAPSGHAELHSEGVVHRIQRSLVADLLLSLNRVVGQEELVVGPCSKQREHTHSDHQWMLHDPTE